MNLDARLKELRKKVQSGGLEKNQGLGNEVNYHIFDYDIEDEHEVMDYAKRLAESNEQICIINIYDVITELLSNKGYLNKVFEFEEKKGSQFAASTVMRFLGVENKNGLLMREICSRITDGKIIFITGIGESYRIIRAHTLLSNLQPVITNNPIILFYPGRYDGQSLRLFDKFEATNYYRAFKLVER